MRTQRVTAIWALSFCLAGPTAQGQADAPASLGQIGPFTDAYTVAVVRVDVDALEVDRWVDLALELIPGERAKVAETLDPHARTVRTGVQQLIDAGAREVYGIVSLSYLGTEPPGWLVLPVAGEGKEDRLLAAVQTFVEGWSMDARLVRGCVVAAPQRVWEALPSGGERQTPETLRLAFSGAPPGTVQAVVVPYPEVERILEEFLPRLPQALGGGSSAVFGQEWLWAAASIGVAPEETVSVFLQFASPSGAAAAAAMIGRGLTALGAWRPVRERLPNWDSVQEALTPAVVDDTLQVRLGQTRIVELIGGTSMPAVEDAKARAMRMAVMGNLKQIALALIMYASDHQDRLPMHLADTLPYLGSDQVLLLPGSTLTIPADLQQRDREAQVTWVDEHGAFSYRLPGVRFDSVQQPSRTVMVYQKMETSQDGWVGAAFADGHAEILTREALERLLE